MLGPGLTLAMALTAQAPQAGQPAKAAEPATSVSGVTVLGPKLKQVPKFVEKLSQPKTEGLVPRWYGDICPMTIGGPAEVNAYFTQRIIELARSVGVRAGEPKCEINTIVVLTDDPDRFTRLAERKRAWLFYNPFAKFPVNWSELRDFVNTYRPVRTWHVVQEADAGSHQVTTDSAAGLSAGLGDFGVPVTHSYGGGSLLKPVVVDKIEQTVLIVDAKAIRGLKPSAVAGYLTMVLLTDPKPEEDFSAIPTIMNLFANAKAGRPAPDDLTHWDKSYLRSFYKVLPGINTNLERSTITAQMAQELKDDDEGPVSPAP